VLYAVIARMDTVPRPVRPVASRPVPCRPDRHTRRSTRLAIESLIDGIHLAAARRAISASTRSSACGAAVALLGHDLSAAQERLLRPYAVTLLLDVDDAGDQLVLAGSRGDPIDTPPFQRLHHMLNKGFETSGRTDRVPRARSERAVLKYFGGIRR